MSGLFRPIRFHHLYCPEDFQCRLRHDGVAVCLYAFRPPLRKGNCVHFSGKPIISPTNRGSSRPLIPDRNFTIPGSLPSSPPELPFQSLAAGVGAIATNRLNVARGTLPSLTWLGLIPAG